MAVWTSIPAQCCAGLGGLLVQPVTQLDGIGGSGHDTGPWAGLSTVILPAVPDHRMVIMDEASGPTLAPGREACWDRLRFVGTLLTHSEQHNNSAFVTHLDMHCPLVLKQ